MNNLSIQQNGQSETKNIPEEHEDFYRELLLQEVT